MDFIFISLFNTGGVYFSSVKNIGGNNAKKETMNGEKLYTVFKRSRINKKIVRGASDEYMVRKRD